MKFEAMCHACKDKYGSGVKREIKKITFSHNMDESCPHDDEEYGCDYGCKPHINGGNIRIELECGHTIFIVAPESHDHDDD